MYKNVRDNKKYGYKYDLEIIILNDSQYFWINLKDFEVETEYNQ